MPEKEPQYIEDPTFEKVRVACLKRGVRVLVPVRDGATTTCRVEVKGNVAEIDFNLWLGTNFSEEAQRRFRDKHGPYLKARVKAFKKPAKSPFFSNFGATGIHFHVLATDADSWFEEVYQALLDAANFTPLPDPFEFLRKRTTPAPSSKTAAAEADSVQQRKLIPPETIRAFYPVVRAVAKGELHRPTGIRQLIDDYGLNENSARDFIDNFRKMLKGEEYQRLYSIFATEYLLERIEMDFGDDSLAKAVSAVQQHLKYYSDLTEGKSTQPTIREMLKRKYSRLLITPGKEDRAAVKQHAEEMENEGTFNPKDETDARRWVLRAIASRQGQPKFRNKLLKAYGSACAITGCTIEPLLDAAHIRRFKGPQTDHSTNGLLLRTDIHTLFDLQLIAIDTSTMTVVVSPELKGTEYGDLAGTELRQPEDAKKRPNTEALQLHREDCGF